MDNSNLQNNSQPQPQPQGQPQQYQPQQQQPQYQPQPQQYQPQQYQPQQYQPQPQQYQPQPQQYQPQPQQYQPQYQQNGPSMQNGYGYSQQSYSRTSGGFAFDRKRYDFKSVIRVDSPAPLSDGMRCSTWLYIPGLLCFGIGAVVVGMVRTIYAEHQVTEVLRKKARFYMPNVSFTQDELLNKLGPYCASSGMTLNVSSQGIIAITRGKFIYDVHFNNDGTYGLWWRKNIVNAFFSLHGRISQYRQVAEDMGIVAYGIQTSLESIANEKGMNQ